MRFVFAAIICLFAAVCATTAPAAPANAADPAGDGRPAEVVVIGTASVSGVYYAVGETLCRLVNRSPANASGRRLSCAVRSTGGSETNLQALRDPRTASPIHLAIVQSDAQARLATASPGADANTGPRELRAVAALYPEMATLVVRRGLAVRKLGDLRGLRLNIGNVGSGHRVVAEDLLRAAGLDARDLAISDLDADRQSEALCATQPTIDAYFYVAGLDAPNVRRAVQQCSATLVALDGPDVEQLLARNRHYRRATIPAGAYGGNAEVRTFAVTATLVAGAGVGDDTVRALLDAAFGPPDRVAGGATFDAELARRLSGNRHLRMLDRRVAAEGLTLPLHDGARSYFAAVSAGGSKPASAP